MDNKWLAIGDVKLTEQILDKYHNHLDAITKRIKTDIFVPAIHGVLLQASLKIIEKIIEDEDLPKAVYYRVDPADREVFKMVLSCIMVDVYVQGINNMRTIAEEDT